MSSNAPKAERIDALTGLRFFATLSVVLAHYAGLIPYPSWILPFITQGQKAVTLFFILSGFILYYNYRRWFDGQVPYDRFWSFARALCPCVSDAFRCTDPHYTGHDLFAPHARERV